MEYYEQTFTVRVARIMKFGLDYTSEPSLVLYHYIEDHTDDVFSVANARGDGNDEFEWTAPKLVTLD